MIKIQVAIFASGNGSNALNIIDHFSGHYTIEIAFVLTNNENAPVIQKSRDKSIETIVLSNSLVSDGDLLTELCLSKSIDFVVLAGYLRLVPKEFIRCYPDRIINIHPSLLPKYGGKGMYGNRVHEAVIESGDKESGISIHWVDEVFDRGKMIAKFYCAIEPGETITSLKEKIQFLEHTYFPVIIEKTIINKNHDRIF